MARLSREHGKMRQLLDDVQDRVQAIWDSGFKVKVTVEATSARRVKSGRDPWVAHIDFKDVVA